MSISSALGGASCAAKTEEGKLVRLQMTYSGTMGGFEKATLTIFDKDGKLEFEHVYRKAGQHAATRHGSKAIFVFHGLSGDADVLLTFVGKDQETDELQKALENPQRKKESGNTMQVSIYKKGQEKEYRLTDIVCSLHSEE